jgi:protein-S-isoprenylcysteine O-methyltransferase Ste14
MPSLENRIPPPLMTLIIAFAMWGASLQTPPLTLGNVVRYDLAAVFFCLAGLFGAPAIQAFRRAKTTIDPIHVERASVVVTTGVYRITRNPMYVAMASLLLSWAMYLANPWSLLGPPLFVLFITWFQILPEERAMAAKFGPSYTGYKNSVRRWV